MGRTAGKDGTDWAEPASNPGRPDIRGGHPVHYTPPSPLLCHKMFHLQHYSDNAVMILGIVANHEVS